MGGALAFVVLKGLLNDEVPPEPIAIGLGDQLGPGAEGLEFGFAEVAQFV
jgi:hypothetical protein